MTPSELSSLEQAYEADPEGMWYALHDAYLECEPPREREAARVRMKQRRGWGWMRSDRDIYFLARGADIRHGIVAIVGRVSLHGIRPVEIWVGEGVTVLGPLPGADAARAAAEDWLLDHGY